MDNGRRMDFNPIVEQPKPETRFVNPTRYIQVDIGNKMVNKKRSDLSHITEIVTH